MAKLNVYAIYDKEVNEYSTSIMVFPTDVHAVRALERIVQREYDLRQHSDKFALYCMGSYDSASGSLICNDKPSFVSEIIDVVKFLNIKKDEQ